MMVDGGYPEWVKILDYLGNKKSRVTLILFMKWDRFSRNAGDAYRMVSILPQMNREPQAIEQPSERFMEDLETNTIG